MLSTPVATTTVSILRSGKRKFADAQAPREEPAWLKDLDSMHVQCTYVHTPAADHIARLSSIEAYKLREQQEEHDGPVLKRKRLQFGEAKTLVFAKEESELATEPLTVVPLTKPSALMAVRVLDQMCGDTADYGADWASGCGTAYLRTYAQESIPEDRADPQFQALMRDTMETVAVQVEALVTQLGVGASADAMLSKEHGDALGVVEGADPTHTQRFLYRVFLPASEDRPHVLELFRQVRDTVVPEVKKKVEELLQPMPTLDSDADDAEPTVFDREEWFSSECSEASTSDGERGEE